MKCFLRLPVMVLDHQPDNPESGKDFTPYSFCRWPFQTPPNALGSSAPG